jgi:hypothetical protein
MTRTERQQESVRKWIKAKGRGTIEGATGYGCLLNKTGYKFYYSNEYLPVQIDTAVLVEKSQELLQGNIGEDCDVNTELTN